MTAGKVGPVFYGKGINSQKNTCSINIFRVDKSFGPNIIGALMQGFY